MITTTPSTQRPRRSQSYDDIRKQQPTRNMLTGSAAIAGDGRPEAKAGSASQAVRHVTLTKRPSEQAWTQARPGVMGDTPGDAKALQVGRLGAQDPQAMPRGLQRQGPLKLQSKPVTILYLASGDGEGDGESPHINAARKRLAQKVFINLDDDARVRQDSPKSPGPDANTHKIEMSASEFGQLLASADTMEKALEVWKNQGHYAIKQNPVPDVIRYDVGGDSERSHRNDALRGSLETIHEQDEEESARRTSEGGGSFVGETDCDTTAGAAEHSRIEAGHAIATATSSAGARGNAHASGEMEEILDQTIVVSEARAMAQDGPSMSARFTGPWLFGKAVKPRGIVNLENDLPRAGQVGVSSAVLGRPAAAPRKALLESRQVKSLNNSLLGRQFAPIKYPVAVGNRAGLEVSSRKPVRVAFGSTIKSGISKRVSGALDVRKVMAVVARTVPPTRAAERIGGGSGFAVLRGAKICYVKRQPGLRGGAVAAPLTPAERQGLDLGDASLLDDQGLYDDVMQLPTNVLVNGSV